MIRVGVFGNRIDSSVNEGNPSENEGNQGIELRDLSAFSASKNEIEESQSVTRSVGSVGFSRIKSTGPLNKSEASTFASTEEMMGNMTPEELKEVRRIKCAGLDRTQPDRLEEMIRRNFTNVFVTR